MAQIDGAGQQDTDNQNAEALQAALAQRQVTLQGPPQGGSDVPIHQNSDPVSDESEILRSCQPLTGKRRNSGKTGGGSVVFASLTRLPLILWRDGSTG
jgi:hypothetical protein